MTLSGLSVSFVTLSIHWLKNGDILQSCSELERDSDTSYHCLLTLTHLSYKSDNGSYSCRGDVTPTPQYPLLRPTSATSDTLDIHVSSKQFTVVFSCCVTHYPILTPVPVVNVTMLSSTIRVLDVPPYNQFEGSCSVSVSVPGLRGEPELKRYWQWKRRGVGEGDLIGVPPSTISSNSSWSSIHYEETRSGSVTYQCVYTLEGIHNIFSGDQLSISVIGKLATLNF